MNTQPQTWIVKNQLGIYFALAYAISWLIWSPLVLSGLGWIETSLPAGWHFLGSFGPLLAAFIVTSLVLGLPGIKNLVWSMFNSRVGARWILFALSGVPAVFLVGVVIISLLQGSWTALGDFGSVPEIPQLGWFAGWLLYVVTFGYGEETGWRGFALPRLQDHFDARKSTLILGVLWLFWHLPVFAYQFQEFNLFQLFGFAIGLLSGAVLLTWLYNSSLGNILVVSLWHGTYNAAVAGAQPVISIIITGAVILFAILIGRRYGPENFSTKPRQVIKT